jgi:hypothetical protein
VCYSKEPGLTVEDLEPGPPVERPSPGGELGRFVAMAAGTGGGAPAGGKKRKAPPAPRAATPDSDDDADASEEQPRGGKRPKMSTAVGLLDAATARTAAPRRRQAPPADGEGAPALAAYPLSMRRFLGAEGYTEATPIQALCWPELLAGRDVQAVAEPGSGKTLGYLLPAAELLIQGGHGGASRPSGPVALVLAPTRELAAQVAGVCRALKRRCGGLRAACVTGGADREAQVEALGRAPHIVVATPGRLLDLVDAGQLSLGEFWARGGGWGGAWGGWVGGGRGGGGRGL